MPFASPIVSPPDWALAVVPDTTVPIGLRYGGAVLRAARATRGVQGSVVSPFPAYLRIHPVDGGGQVLELQLLTPRAAAVARRFRFGAPTLYLVVNGAAASAEDRTFVDGDVLLASAADVTMAFAWQERVALDPVVSARLVLEALAAAGETTAGWAALVDRLDAQLGAPVLAPLLLLDHAGQPIPSGRFRVQYLDGGGAPAGTVEVDLTPADAGDLRAAVRRSNAADPANFPVADLWTPLPVGGSARLRPLGAGIEAQLVSVADGTSSASEIAIGPATRHISVTDLHGWFASPSGTGSPPPRFRRGCRVTPLVNGPEYFQEFFAEINRAAAGGSPGLSLAGWSMFPDVLFVTPPPGAPNNFARSLREASTLIVAGGGRCSFLPSEFVHIEDPQAVQTAELFLVFVVIGGIFVFASTGWLTTDGVGAIVLVLLLIANPPLIEWLTTDGSSAFEQNQAAVDELHDPPGAEAVLDAYPITIDDNPIAPPANDSVYTHLFKATRHFGVFHQKIAAVRDGARLIAYCGGIDLNPDRLDDERHLAQDTPGGVPYHDVHARIEGPAVRDILHTFNERWARASGNVDPAIATPAEGAIAPAGEDIVQVARTYAPSASNQRRLPYAPAGERTVLDTMLAAVGRAREFIYFEDQYFTPPKELRDALLAWVGAPGNHRLIAVIPGANDQLFGEIVRTRFFDDLLAADGGRGTVILGAPRRRYTSADSEVRASSGRLVLQEDLLGLDESGLGGATVQPQSILLAPRARLPSPPFWVCINGELMWAYDEDQTFVPSGTSIAPGEGPMRLLVERGTGTRLLRGLGTPQGPSTREHKAGAAATVVTLDDIYVHAKMVIIDDVFLGVGSANLNRRGFYHDAEAQVYTVPAGLRWGPTNPIAALRRRLWAEMLDLPLPLADGLLRDPLAASELFRRSYFLGNRIVDPLASPLHGMFGGIRGGDAMVSFVLGALFGTAIAFEHGRLFDGVVDPTTTLDPDQEQTL